MRRQQLMISCAAFAGLGLFAPSVRADFSTGFESPSYASGQPLTGQDTWVATEYYSGYSTGTGQFTFYQVPAATVTVSNAHPSTGSQAANVSLIAYDSGGTYSAGGGDTVLVPGISGFDVSRSVPATSGATLVSFDLSINNTAATLNAGHAVEKAFYLTNAEGNVIAGIDFQADNSGTNNGVAFYTSFDNGGTNFPTSPIPGAHHTAFGGTNLNLVAASNAYQTWGIEEDPTANGGNGQITYFLNHQAVFSTPSFGEKVTGTNPRTVAPDNGIAGLTLEVFNQSGDIPPTNETVDLDNIIVGPPPVVTTNSVWALTGSGPWNSSSSWTGGIPNAVGSTAAFSNQITADATVNMTVGETVGGITFDNSHRYTIAGTSALTLSASSGAASINVNSGSHTIQTPLIFTADLNVTTAADPGVGNPSLTLPLNITATGTLTKTGPGTLSFPASSGGIVALTLPAISVSGGTLALSSTNTHTNRIVLVTSALSINSGKVDVSNNDLIVQGGGATTLGSVTTLLKSGFNAGAGYWNGAAGIVSSSASGDTRFLTTLGVRQSPGGLVDTVGTTTSDTLVKYTYYGDADLNGVVNGADYQQIDLGFGSHSTGWFNGDFNYDGVVNGSDYALIDNTFNQITAQSAGALAIIAGPSNLIANPSLVGAVPEPGSLGLLIFGSSLVVQLRRRVCI